MPDYEYVLSTSDGPVGIVTLNRPKQLNALAGPLMAELVDALEAHDADEAIRAIPIEWFKASPAIYWADLLGSAALGWGSFAAGVTASGWTRVLWLTVATFALYRAVLFIHEITHRAQRDVPAFTLVWNVLVGVPLLVPSFTYEGVHTDHHRQRSCRL